MKSTAFHNTRSYAHCLGADKNDMTPIKRLYKVFARPGARPNQADAIASLQLLQEGPIDQGHEESIDGRHLPAERDHNVSLTEWYGHNVRFLEW